MTETIIFDPFTSQLGVSVEVPNNFVSERRKEFNISTRVEAINSTGALTAVEGQPVRIIVYDNDCKYIILFSCEWCTI